MKIKNLLSFILLYLGILLFGLFIIYATQYQYHSNTSYTASKIAKDWNETGQIKAGKEHLHGCIYLLRANDSTPVLLHCSDNPLIYEDFMTNFIARHDSSKSLYQISAQLSPLTFFSIASSPLYTDEKFTGCIYIAYTIKYLPTFFNVFLLLYTFTYCILYMHLFFMHRTNNKISFIYRKYIANISHELKSPIASIHAITETLNAGLIEDEETLHRYYGIIDRESHRLEQSVLDIIELSKIQDQRIDVSKRMTSISDIMTPISKRYEEFCEDVGINFLINSSVSKLPDLYTNPDRIIQLLQILLDNAAKFTAENGTISIHAECDDKQAIICVSDTGCGMDEETISHIFERFYRGTNTSEYAGSGLGLSIAKELVNALDEKIWAQSELGVGTDFYFTVSRKKRKWKLKL